MDGATKFVSSNVKVGISIGVRIRHENDLAVAGNMFDIQVVRRRKPDDPYGGA